MIYLSEIFAVLVIVLSCVLFAFSHHRKAHISIQITFVYLAVNYTTLLLKYYVESSLLNGIFLSLGFIEGPVIYSLTVCFAAGRYKHLNYLHYLPALAALCWYLMFLSGMDNLYLISAISRVIYASLCFNLIWAVRAEATQSSWYRWLLLFVSYVIVVAAIKLYGATLYLLIDNWSTPVWLSFSKTTGALIISLCILWWALIKPDIYQHGRQIDTTATPQPSPSEKEVYDQIIQLFEEDLIYKEPDLNVTALAKRLGYSQREVSESINRVTTNGFRALLRKYRLKEAKRLLIASNERSVNILEVAHQAGFSSKSVFNHAFKEETGLTPTAFRKSAH